MQGLVNTTKKRVFSGGFFPAVSVDRRYIQCIAAVFIAAAFYGTLRRFRLPILTKFN
jgi:hypothetical protein